MLVANFSNAMINLEGTTAYLNTAPKKFLQILGAFLAVGAAERIIWATGCVALHPQPLLERFWSLEMPEDLIELGVPPLSPETKRAILGENAGRIVGLDLERMKKEMAGDEFSGRGEYAAPWSGGR
jgi:predicted TIM-barrel fold metal-dependent hydrolase